MTDEQIRLYAIARCVTPSGTRIRTISDQVKGGGTLYTLELKTPGGTLERWFAVHHGTLVRGLFSDGAIAEQIRQAISRPPTPRFAQARDGG